MRLLTVFLALAPALIVHGQTTNLPPLPNGTEFAVGTNITIDAPIDTVWDVLLDWDKYAEWNPFVR